MGINSNYSTKKDSNITEIVLENDNNKIIWIDQNVNNLENKHTLKYFKKELKDNYDIITFESVSETFNLLKKLENVFKFKLLYVIVSGRLAEEFFNNYAEKVIDMNILCASIIYCFNDSFHKKKNYYRDSFLNPGGIVSTPEKVVEYIKKIENKPKIIQINQNSQDYKKESFGFIYNYAENLSEIILPLIISHFLKSYLITKKDLEQTENNFLSMFGEKIIDYIYPQKEKKISIPLHILAKYYARLYTVECDFYKRLNKDLSNKHFDLYRTYIFLLYNGIHKKTLKNYCSSKLYRGAALTMAEYQSIKKYLEIKKNNIDKNSAVLYYLKNFASFSEERAAKHFLLNSISINNENKDLINIEYIIDENMDENFFVANLDLENLSNYPEKEVLFLPLSCFEIYSIEEMKNYSIIRLRYLTKYKTQMLEHIEKLETKKNIQSFFEKIVESKYAKDIAEIIGPQAQDKIDTFIKKGNKNELKQAILYISSAFFISTFTAIGINGFLSLFPNFVPFAPYIPNLLPLIVGLGFSYHAYKKYHKTLIFESNSLYSKYIPEKYRNSKIFPSFSWNNVNSNTKSFMIQLIEDDINKKWQVINIPKQSRKIIENEEIIGETTIEYKGISDNASCALFILYEINKEKITLKEANDIEILKELVLNMAFIEVY